MVFEVDPLTERREASIITFLQRTKSSVIAELVAGLLVVVVMLLVAGAMVEASVLEMFCGTGARMVMSEFKMPCCRPTRSFPGAHESAPFSFLELLGSALQISLGRQSGAWAEACFLDRCLVRMEFGSTSSSDGAAFLFPV